MPSNMRAFSQAAFARFHDNKLEVDFKKLGAVFNDFHAFRQMFEGLEREMRKAILEVRESPARLDQMGNAVSRNDSRLVRLERRMAVVEDYVKTLRETTIRKGDAIEMPRPVVVKAPGTFKRVTTAFLFGMLGAATWAWVMGLV